ncbi:MAG TPA: phytochelatin synthase family protein [Steroidobacteraceae bacterium]
MSQTLYRRPLPSDAIAFSSLEGRQVFVEALAAGGLNGYFRLAEQFHTQSDPAFCGLGSLVVALNALAIDPERLWKGPWRWFAEDLLDCCVPLADVRERGLDLDELACLARCNGAEVDVQRTDTSNLVAWHSALEIAASGDAVVVASYDRSAMGQSGGGHFSPIGGYHAARELALVLDVARFKYPPHWVAAEVLWRAMEPIDPETGRARGWLVMRRRPRSSSLSFSVTCVGENWHGLSRRLNDVIAELALSPGPAELARAILPLALHLETCSTGSAAHQEALLAARTALRSSRVYPRIQQEVGSEHADAVTILLFAISDHLKPGQRDELGTLNGPITEELSSLRAQLAALSGIKTRPEARHGLGE